MNDIFIEQLIKRNQQSKDFFFKSLIVAAAAFVSVVLVLVLHIIGMLLAVGVFFLSRFLVGRFNREFEYTFTNGELDIDVIYNRASRKRIFTGTVKEIELMAHVTDDQHMFRVAQESRDCSTGEITDNTYAFVTKYRGKLTKFVIEPKEELLEAMAKILTRLKFIRRK